jgi:hypothetical protein
MSNNTDGFETLGEIKLNHQPNNARLIIQRQKGTMIPKDKVQFGLPTVFVNPENKELVWNRGPSIQLEQIPELIELLQKVYAKYSDGKALPMTTTAASKTGTFADLLDE